MSQEIALTLISIAISVSLGAIGSSLGIGAVAKASAGLLSKEPQKFPQSLILSALPSTQAIYGLLFGFIVLVQVGLLGGQVATISMQSALAYIFASMPVGIAGLFSGISQGQIAAAGVKILAKNPDKMSQGIVLAALVESFAIFGFIISLLITIAISS